MILKLSDLCTFAYGRVAVSGLNLDTYISTENMLPSKEGITRSAGLPAITQIQAYQVNDVLVSNIRPYFKKIWFADRDGGCSNDVLVIRAKEGCNPGFLYYLLSDDVFFDYATATAKGTKMPRGDKSAIMRYEVPDLPIDTQIKIADTLSALDDKIANNKAINNHLEQMAQAIFKSWFVDFEPWGGEMPENWREGTLGEICEYGKKRATVSNLTTATYISTENIQPNKAGYVDATSLPSISQTTAFNSGDVLVSNIRPYFKKIVYCDFIGGCSTDVLCFHPNNVPSSYLYSVLYSDFFFEYMVSGSKGTKMPRGDKAQIMQYPVVIPFKEVLEQFDNAVYPTLLAIATNKTENANLASIRDTLLPRLMSGELPISVRALVLP